MSKKFYQVMRRLFLCAEVLKRIKQKKAIGAGFICVNGIYNLNNLNYPSLVVGTVDVNKKFHLIAFGITRTESTKVYECFIASVMKIARLLTPEYDPRPNYIMTDFSPAIHAAVTETLPITKILNCKFYFWNIINPKLKSNALIPKKIVEKPLQTRYKNVFSLKNFQ